jgi:SSU ribosomal protein S11P
LPLGSGGIHVNADRYESSPFAANEKLQMQ